MKNRTMPDCSIIPVLTYQNIDSAINWLCDTLGFIERWRVGQHRAQLRFGNSVVVVTSSNQKGDTNKYSLLVRIENMAEHFEHTKLKGATILQAPQIFPYGEKQYSIQDPEGHIWTFSESVQDLVPEDWGGVSNLLE